MKIALRQDAKNGDVKKLCWLALLAHRRKPEHKIRRHCACLCAANALDLNLIPRLPQTRRIDQSDGETVEVQRGLYEIAGRAGDRGDNGDIAADKGVHQRGFAGIGRPRKDHRESPLEDLAACAEELRARMTAYPGVAAYGVFGHLGDGNIHVELCGPPSDDEGVDSAVLSIVGEYSGSVSAEHGIGRVKARWLSLSRTEQEIALMRSIKSAWDPHAIMNPGVLFA